MINKGSEVPENSKILHKSFLIINNLEIINNITTMVHSCNIITPVIITPSLDLPLISVI